MNRPMRFCMITTFYPPYSFGGDSVFVQNLSNALARLGHHVEVIHCIDSYRAVGGRPPEHAYRDHSNVIVHGLESPVGILSPVATQLTGLPLFKAARIAKILESGFDVIHYHNISLVGGPGILRLGEGLKLYTMHEYWLVCPTHVLFKFNRSVCARPHCFLCSLSHGRPPQLWRYPGFLRGIEKHVDTFLAPSRFCMQQHREMGLTAPIVRLPNFVSLAERPPSSAAPARNGETQRPYFLFVGRLEKIKGLQTVIPLFRRFPGAELWIAGEGGDEPHLKKLAGSKENVRFLGFQRREALNDLYQGAVALIVPSLCLEVASSVIPEAFMHRTPVLARRLGGMQEMIEESGGGLLFETEQELQDGMRRLLEDPTYREELGARGHEAYRREWAKDVHLKRYFALIGRFR